MIKIKETLTLAVSILIIWGGCGIPDIPYIEEPEATTVANLDGPEQLAVFRNAYENDPKYFYGYSLYYKFFTNEEDITGSYEKHKTDNDRSDLLNDDFFFLYRMTEETEGIFIDNGLPMTIELEDSRKNDNFLLTLDFTGDIIETVDSAPFGTTISYNSEVIPVGRHIEQNRVGDGTLDPVNKYFRNTEFSENDEDIPEDDSVFQIANTDAIYLAVYVLSFGKKTDGIQLYSEPVFLGNFELQVSSDS